MRLGRRIYDNLRKAVGFIFAVHVPIAGLALTPLVFGLPVLFGPVHIAFIEMVIDPVGSLVFEAEVEEDDVMRRPPRPPAEPMAPASFVAWSLFQGVFAFAIVAGVLFVGLRRGMPMDEVRALTFFALILVTTGLILINRSFSASVWTAVGRPNPTLLWILLIIAAILALTLEWPFAADLFRFGPLHPDDLALTVGAGVIVFACLDALKLFRRAWRGRGSGPAERPARDAERRSSWRNATGPSTLLLTRSGRAAPSLIISGPVQQHAMAHGVVDLGAAPESPGSSVE